MEMLVYMPAETNQQGQTRAERGNDAIASHGLSLRVVEHGQVDPVVGPPEASVRLPCWYVLDGADENGNTWGGLKWLTDFLAALPAPDHTEPPMAEQQDPVVEQTPPDVQDVQKPEPQRPPWFEHARRRHMRAFPGLYTPAILQEHTLTALVDPNVHALHFAIEPVRVDPFSGLQRDMTGPYCLVKPLNSEDIRGPYNVALMDWETVEPEDDCYQLAQEFADVWGSVIATVNDDSDSIMLSINPAYKIPMPRPPRRV